MSTTFGSSRDNRRGRSSLRRACSKRAREVCLRYDLSGGTWSSELENFLLQVSKADKEWTWLSVKHGAGFSCESVVIRRDTSDERAVTQISGRCLRRWPPWLLDVVDASKGEMYRVNLSEDGFVCPGTVRGARVSWLRVRRLSCQ